MRSGWMALFTLMCGAAISGTARAEGTGPVSATASNTGANNALSTVAPRLPAPAVGENAGPRQFLLIAGGDMMSGRGGAAQEALERAESRLLDRSVPIGTQDEPIRGRAVTTIAEARRALGGGNTPRAVQLVDQALALLAAEPPRDVGPEGVAAMPPPPPTVMPATVIPLIQTSPLPPPPLPVEVVPPPPAPSYVWEPGHWNWNGGAGYAWQPGRYVLTPPSATAFAQGHWAFQGGGWVWIPPHWQ